jgi:hypothetical protein
MERVSEMEREDIEGFLCRDEKGLLLPCEQ